MDFLAVLGLPLMKNVLKPLAKNVLIPLRLTAAATADAGIHKKILSLGGSYDPRAINSQYPWVLAQQTTILTKSNKEMENILKYKNHLKTLIY